MSERGGRHVALEGGGVGAGGSASWPVRAVAVVRALWGAVLLTRARSVVVALEPGLARSAVAPWVVRVLGGRHVGQAAVTTARPSREIAWLGTAADLLHGFTALLYAASGRSRRRAGLTSAGVAVGFGAATVLATRPQMARGRRGSAASAPEASVGESKTAPPGGVQPASLEASGRSRVPEQRTGDSTPDAAGQTREDDSRSAQRAESKQTLVRPRVLWPGVALAILGMVFIALAMILMWGWWVWAGVGVLGVGLLIAWRGGVLNDVQSGEPMSQELQEAAKGGTHHGVAAGQQIQDREAQKQALATTERSDRLHAAVAGTSAPVRPAASVVLLFLGAWIFIGTFVIPHSYTNVGQNSALRDLGFAIVVFLSALWLRNIGPNRVVSGIVVLAGVLMVLEAFLLPHDSLAVAVDDGLTGTFVVLAGVLSTVRSGTDT